MGKNKKILFLTGTRADFGKLKSLIAAVASSDKLEPNLFVTGMHMLSKYGMTRQEVLEAELCPSYAFINQGSSDTMDVILAKTISGLSDYVKEIQPDMIVVHGDRVEALAGAIVGSLNNILVGHIEGGEVSGTIDELIRHAVTKLSHIHFVCNEEAKQRLLQLGESSESIFVIGSPDMDIMLSRELPTLDTAKKHYDVPYDEYAVVLYHPVTTEVGKLSEHVEQLVSALVASGDNFIVIYPNNDHGTDIILGGYAELEGNSNFRIFPSIRFEYFLTLLKNAKYIVGNSSAGIREAPVYGVPTIDVGSRQHNRAFSPSILNVAEDSCAILDGIAKMEHRSFASQCSFGTGTSGDLFLSHLECQDVWQTSTQKVFVDRAGNVHQQVFLGL